MSGWGCGMSSRANLLLHIARRNGGLIDRDISLALLPAVRPRTLRQLLEDLEKRGALRSAWVSGEWPSRKVWMDRMAQRSYLAGVAILPGKAPSADMGDKFMHRMMSTELVVGLTDPDRLEDARLDYELERTQGRSAPDGHLVLRDGSRLLLELERMIGQSWEHWANAGEIGDSIAAHMRSNASSRYLVCAPKHHLLHLPEAVVQADRRRYGGRPPSLPPGAGCWIVSTEDHRADLEWCSFGAEDGESRHIAGISSIRRTARARLAVQPRIPATRVAQAVPHAQLPTTPTPANVLAAPCAQERDEVTVTPLAQLPRQPTPQEALAALRAKKRAEASAAPAAPLPRQPTPAEALAALRAKKRAEASAVG